MIFAIIALVLAYLFGSINFAVIFSSIFLKKDVRELGSGNAGTTNVMRSAGFLPGALTFVFDALKGFAACYVGKLLFEYAATKTDAFWAEGIYGAFACGLLCMLGHIFPIFFGFKGGKGVATSVGIFAVCSPIAIISGLSVFAVVLLVSKMVSLASLIATVVVVVLSIVLYNGASSILPIIILSIVMGSLVFIKHKDNIKRLINGTERKIGKGGKK